MLTRKLIFREVLLTHTELIQGKELAGQNTQADHSVVDRIWGDLAKIVLDVSLISHNLFRQVPRQLREITDMSHAKL